MKKTLYDYKEQIMSLPKKEKYEKDELMIPGLLVEQEKNLSIYYAPHNEYINSNAKIFIVGITPGFYQMSTAIAVARRELEEGKSIEEVQYACKDAARFTGPLRKNLISMLDELEIAEYYGIESAADLFADRDDLLHTVSLIPYSVFVKGANYTGHTPKLRKSLFLMKYVYENFVEELGALRDKDKVLIVPLGAAVEEALEELADKNIVKHEQILKGFPHPSGANVNRVAQFEENKESMKHILDKMYQ